MGTGNAPDIHRRPHQAPKGRLASDDLGVGSKSSRGFLQKIYPIEFTIVFPLGSRWRRTVVTIAELHYAAIALVDNAPGLRVVIRFSA
jgi:hypothetical protein